MSMNRRNLFGFLAGGAVAAPAMVAAVKASPLAVGRDQMGPSDYSRIGNASHTHTISAWPECELPSSINAQARQMMVEQRLRRG